MSSQPNITNYFNTRKRAGCNNIKSRAKILVLEAEKANKKLLDQASSKCDDGPRVIFQETKKFEDLASSSTSKRPSAVKKTSQSTKKKKQDGNVTGKDKLKQSLLTQFTKKPSTSSTPEAEEIEEVASTSSQNDPTQPTTPVASTHKTRSSRSPAVRVSSTKVVSIRSLTPHRATGAARSLNFGESSKEAAGLPSKPSTASNITPNKVKNMSMAEVAARLRNSGRVGELKASLSKFAKLGERLQEVEAEDAKLKLKQFSVIEVDVPLSPKKDIPYSSPSKVPQSPRLLPSTLISPSKTLGSRLAAWQQHRALAEARTPTLPLPWHSRCLLETFRAIDVVATMMVNRKETVNFAKLQPAVEEMTRHSFTEKHLGQIKHLYPEAFSFEIRKQKTFALTGRPDKYDLIVIPNFEQNGNGASNEDGSKQLVDSALLQGRREHFHSLLVDRVKDCHQEFLSHLEPPMEIPREKLTRWHPGFDPEQVPEVPSDPLPKPPTHQKISTATEVLNCARSQFSCNRRLTQALEKASMSEQSATSSQECTDDNEGTSQSSEDSNSNPAPLNPAFRGIPNSLLEKIRAKQAARAVEAMTRTPAQDKRKERLSRLPELARVLRNIYVAEKRGVMPLDTVLEKLLHSFPHKLATSELVEHVELLASEAPVLVQRLTMRQTIFIKVDRQANMSQVMATLEKHVRPF